MSRIPLPLFFGLNILLLWKAKCVLLISSQSHLCESMDLPCNPNQPETCHMKYYKLNSTECKELIFDEKLPSQPEASDLLGNVELKSFYYSILSYKMTAFNITFSNIKWKHLKFRFRQIGNEMKNTCREFYVLKNTTMNDIFYDCIWSNETYEGKPFFFEYEAINDLGKVYRKFSFHVPLAKNMDETFTYIEDWETFSYVEAVSVSNGLGPTTFFLYWQPLPEKYFIQKYNISVISNDTGVPVLIYSTNITCNSVKNCNFAYSKWYGALQFGVQPICKNSILCSTTKTLNFQVGTEKAKPLLIGIICTTFIVPVILYIWYMARKCASMKDVEAMKPKPKLLFIYDSTVSSHVNVCFTFAEYLKNYCNIEPLIDELQIFSSKSRDPFKWCNDSFKACNCVMLVASPTCNCKETPDSVYRRTNLLLLRLVRENISMQNCRKKFFVLMLPYVTEKDVPEEGKNLKKFYFPRHLNKLLKFVHGNHVMSDFFSGELPGDKKDYKIYGKKLNNAIQEAQQHIKTKLNAEPSVSSVREDREIESEHELLTVKKRNPAHFCQSSVNSRASLKEMAMETFAEYPGCLESINLLGEEEEEFEKMTDCRKSIENNQNVIDIRELQL